MIGLRMASSPQSHGAPGQPSGSEQLTYLEQSLAAIESFEGAIPWMYRDTVGKVTVAVGLMLPDTAAAARLPFLLAGRAATPAEVAAEFARVDALPMGRPALFYRGKAGPELAADTIKSLLRSVLTDFEGELRQHLTGYDALPAPAKLALLDMAYNLGPANLLREYTRMLKFIAAGDWPQAAAACSRRGPGPARNDWTRKMLLSNIVPAIHAVAEAESKLKQFGYGLLGLGATLWDRIKREPGH